MDENDEGAMVATVTTENASEVTADNDYFEVADGNLKLKDGMSLDFENVEGGMIELTLTASGDGESATAMVTVTVNDVNEDPSIDVRDGEEVPEHEGVISNLTIAENAMKGDEGVPPLALIEVMDPDSGEVLIGQDAADAVTITGEQADKFQVILDPVDGLWLHLADGASLDYEEDGEVTITVTFTDKGGLTAEQDVTVMVTDMNEPPVAVGMVDTVTANAGKAVDVQLDLDALFNDPDAGDASLRYELSGNPSWLSLTTDGRLRGEPPTTGDESVGTSMVTLTATDSGGESGSVSFYVVVDDGNDDVTGVNLQDENGNAVAEVDVDENDASGVVLGQITVDDIDDPRHPHGQHLVTVTAVNGNEFDDRFEIREDDEGRMWLALKQGVSLDTERGSEVEVTVTAVDINGERLPNGRYKGNSDSETFAVIVNNENDG
ncbi:MAG: putative Ig domain-containing protein, partial [Gammaproteobacteria bacterium]|nr:putative Ig domain-containing protein [Gammaproteobacteria bacterium]